ncbi:MAG: hypothetical protein A2V70_15125 [Planctomycetes bacterium RBG_13_63_9]|nr:MAG: hypothetical protein A2V70_15125 [Planctomycetes bacterium RBG_13_63_9]
MIAVKKELLSEGVYTLDGVRWSDGHAWCELRPSYNPRSTAVSIRYLWASECRKGYGTALLGKVVRVADRLGRALYLEVEPFRKQAQGNSFCFEGLRPGGMSRDQLEAWYQRYGFERLKGNMMVRRAAGAESRRENPISTAGRPTTTPFPLEEEGQAVRVCPLGPKDNLPPGQVTLGGTGQ